MPRAGLLRRHSRRRSYSPAQWLTPVVLTAPENPMGVAIALPLNAVIRVLEMNDERHYDLIRDRQRNKHEPGQDKHESDD
jgi:type IV secretory pathway VirB3-like protein